MSEVQGEYDDRFSPLRDLFQENLNAGEELGASIAVVRNGVSLLDLWGGWTDTERSTPWVQDTITTTWSVTKTMTALAALVLVDRGELNVYSPVAKYWPEFAANGKAGIEVRHLLSHTSGVSGWEPPFAPDDIYDWDRSTSLLAAQAPWWEPGSASGYHANSYGHLVGEVVRRITGTSIGRFFADEIAGPLGADFHIGLPEKDLPRVSNVVFRAIRFQRIRSRSRWIPTACRPRPPARRSMRWRRRRPMLGVAPRSLPATGTATRDPWRGSSRSSPTRARLTVSGCCHRQRLS